MNITLTNTIKYLFLAFLILSLSNCGIYRKTSSREVPTNSLERAKKNIAEGKGISIQNAFGKKGGTNYEFSSSNPMWRASLETLDFMPFTTVDYSGGIIITDWYTNETETKESIKITLRFLSNEIRSDSIKIIVHQRLCSKDNSCNTVILNSKIKEELIASILKKAVIFEEELKKK